MPWVSDLARNIPYTYFTDRSKVEKEKPGFDLLLGTKDRIVKENQFWLTDGATGGPCDQEGNFRCSSEESQ